MACERWSLSDCRWKQWHLAGDLLNCLVLRHAWDFASVRTAVVAAYLGPNFYSFRAAGYTSSINVIVIILSSHGLGRTAWSDSEFVLKEWIIYAFGRLGRGIVPVHGLRWNRTTSHEVTQNRGHTSVFGSRFEPTMKVFERSNTVRALDHSSSTIINVKCACQY